MKRLDKQYVQVTQDFDTAISLGDMTEALRLRDISDAIEEERHRIEYD